RTLLPQSEAAPPSSQGSRAAPPQRSFPTRRSSDLHTAAHPLRIDAVPQDGAQLGKLHPVVAAEHLGGVAGGVCEHGAAGVHQERSEEHTSELQSRENLVCRLLLEKKNTWPHRRHGQ